MTSKKTKNKNYQEENLKINKETLKYSRKTICQNRLMIFLTFVGVLIAIISFLVLIGIRLDLQSFFTEKATLKEYDVTFTLDPDSSPMGNDKEYDVVLTVKNTGIKTINDFRANLRNIGFYANDTKKYIVPRIKKGYSQDSLDYTDSLFFINTFKVGDEYNATLTLSPCNDCSAEEKNIQFFIHFTSSPPKIQSPKILNLTIS